MCNNFIEDIAWKIGKKVAKCDCVNLKTLCSEKNPTFQFTSKDVRQLFTETEFYGAHGYDYSEMFRNFDYRREFVDMALCYLHEENVEKFFLLISHMSEYNYGNLNIDPSIKLYAKNLIQRHLSCISLNLFDKYYVHVGFGEWNERDELELWDFWLIHKHKRFTSLDSHQKYIEVTLSYWLRVFLTEEKPRTHMYNDLIRANKENKPPYGYLPDFKFEVEKCEMSKIQKFSKTEIFIQKLGKRILNVLECKCVKYKGFQYVPVNIRNILKSFKLHSHQIGFMYDICRFKTYMDTDEIKVIPLFLDMALCCLYEKDYTEFVNIAASVGMKLNLGTWLKKHINVVNYTDVKKYRVNIDMIHKECWKLYIKGRKKDNTIKKHNEYSIHAMSEKCTDFERYGSPFSKKYLNINLDRFLSDLMVHDNPYPIWQKIWKKGLKNKSNIFL